MTQLSNNLKLNSSKMMNSAQKCEAKVLYNCKWSNDCQKRQTTPYYDWKKTRENDHTVMSKQNIITYFLKFRSF